jgi:Flp pilus assembly pilin Flp
MATKPGVKPQYGEISRLTPCREKTVMEMIIKFTGDEAGASAVEYAFLMAFIAIGLIASLTSLNSALTNLYASIPWPH